MPSPRKQPWQNPRDIMKTHRIKRQSSITKTQRGSSKSAANCGAKIVCDDSSTSKTEHFSKLQAASESMKRKNPFISKANAAQTSGKRRSILSLEIGDSADSDIPRNARIEPSASHVDPNRCPSEPSKLLGILRKAEQMDEPEDVKSANMEHIPQTKDTCGTFYHHPSFLKEGGIKLDSEKQERVPVQNDRAHKSPPIDWSLKTKMRVVVESREESFKRIPGIDAKNVTNFIHHTLENGPDWNDLDIFQKLRRCCFHYSYPQFPWMRRFPRSSAEFRSRSTFLFTNNDDVLRDMQSDWTNVFTSLYQQLQGGICPYFYTCTHQFTVLFRNQRFSSEKASISALLSPSTRGFRELLAKEDIAFRLPNVNMHKTELIEDKKAEDYEQKSGACMAADSQDILNMEATEHDDILSDNHDDDEEEDVINDHDGASKWLEGMGLDKKDFPTLEPSKVKLQRDDFRKIDNRPQSLIYIEGGDVHAFFNFLLNYPSCIASSGPQIGLPPTLVAPVPFVGGSLVQNTVKHSSLRDISAKLPESQHLSYSHVFEISGPILPHHTLNIAAILYDYHQSEGNSSVLTYNTHLPSAALNTQAVNQPEKDQMAMNLHKLFVDISFANSGLLTRVKDSILKSSQLSNGAYLKEMKISKHGFLWS
ncbi:protein downstream neighbor of son [Plakobranchus ocellatus]|uniref:Protein downstream neighbor of son n=1 Tax=Plakobranchus ocellatus TaxID=259542 RepID=A0AAV3ZEB7_9GAST|nr:protein downstream neighbor of son [Plakobranchus ocellatus]